jgi:hypothetical protein
VDEPVDHRGGDDVVAEDLASGAEGLVAGDDQAGALVAHLDGRLARIATMLEDAEPDILAFYAFARDHWRKLRSTNPLERFNREDRAAHRGL